ncbi:hypothetical protein HPB52_020768 [Rhipicephalus sanguineus]|uniref:MADF domain-containing protein n=2 Tax=Rhipicephalus sanguineus TaxID=34632 RepID=A0A9D4QAE5_RHISA|nr:hypothetical protein HPB52_020768 [Rhipicephalus sanguineus]
MVQVQYQGNRRMAEHCANNDPMSGGAGAAAGDSPGLCVSQKIHWPHNVTCYLVKFYRQTPCLWDHSHRDYSDKMAKERALQQFSNETGYPVEAVRKKLINLRNQFTNEWQKMDRSSNSAKPYRTKWAFYKSLTFLKDVVLPRKPRNALHHEGVHLRMPPMGVQAFDTRSMDMSTSFGFARERRLHDAQQFHHDGLRLDNSPQNHQNHRAVQSNNDDSSHLDGAAGAPALLDGLQHQEAHRDGSSHQTPPQQQPQDQDVTVIGAGADVDDLELSQSSNSLVLSPEVTLEEPSSSERRILPAEDDGFHQEIRQTYTFPGERYGDIQRGDHVDAFTCYIGTELRRIPDEETVGQLKLQILKLIFNAQATTAAYQGSAHAQQ